MNELREKLLNGYQAGNLFKTAFEYAGQGEENLENVTKELVVLHNEGEINLINQFLGVFNNKDLGLDFFFIKQIMEDALPFLKADVKPVMECVTHMLKESRRDISAVSVFEPFIDFCAADPSRPEQALALIKTSADLWMEFIESVIVAGARIDVSQYFREAISLSAHGDIEVRKRAIDSFGRIQYEEHDDLRKKALDRLKKSVSEESDDQLLGSAIRSTCSICMNDSALIEGGEILDIALSKGGDYAFHAVAEVFGTQVHKVPEPLLNVMLQYLPKINPLNIRTVDMLDYGIVKLLKRDDPALGIEVLESILLAHDGELSLKSLDSVVNKILRSEKNLLNKLLTKWFLKGDYALCKGIKVIVNAAHEQELQPEVDINELPQVDFDHLYFLARKAIGYLFLKPIAAASVIISLMHLTDDDAAVKELGSLLFNPLLLNSGGLYDFLESRIASESGPTKDAIQIALNTFDAYLEKLKSVGTIPAMHPSQEQRETYARHMNEIMSEALKDAMKGSILNIICQKNVILYGKKAVVHVESPQGPFNRMEIPMKEHRTEMETPRQEHIDPVGLDYMLRRFMAEKLATT